MSAAPFRCPQSPNLHVVRPIFCLLALLLIAVLPSATVVGQAAPLPTEVFGPDAPLVGDSSADGLAVASGWPAPTPYTITGMQIPNGLAVNASTGRLYVTSRNNNSVLMINATNMQMLKQTTVGTSPWGVAVNPITNKVYVANFLGDTLSVLDGVTLQLLTTIDLGAGSRPTFVAVMPSNNTIVVVLHGWSAFTVIDGAQDRAVGSVWPESRGAWGLAVDDKRNRVFVSFRNSGTVEVFDQYPHWSTPFHGVVSPCGVTPYGSPYALAFNSANDQLYVACAHADGNVDTAVAYSVWDDGVPREIGRVAIDFGGSNGGGGVAVNPGSGNAFFTNSLSGTVSVMGGLSNRVIAKLSTGVDPFGIAVDSSTGRVYVGDRGGNRIFVFTDVLETLVGCRYNIFGVAGIYDAGRNPNSVAVGDFNRDGKRDLAVANGTDFLGGNGGVSVLLGNGNGTFLAPVTYTAREDPVYVAVGDFNVDHKLDLVVANYNSGNYLHGSYVSVLLGNGDGTFGPAADYEVGYGPDSIAVGDFNRDGKPDLAVANAGVGSIMSVLLGNGDGTFQSAVHYVTGFHPMSVAVGDFNRDAKPDLVVVNWGISDDVGSVSILLGNGDGTFQSAMNYNYGTMFSKPGPVAVGDFNGDSKLDLAIADTDRDMVSVWRGNGDGTFVPGGYGDWGSSVTAGDLNGDGKLDLAVQIGGNRVSVLWGNGDGTFRAASYDAGGGAGSIAIGDFNGDGKPDLAVQIGVSEGVGKVSVLLNGCGPHVVFPVFLR